MRHHRQPLIVHYGQLLREAGRAAQISADLGLRPLQGDAVMQALDELFTRPETLRSMSEAASKLARPDAADRIVDACAALLAREPR